MIHIRKTILAACALVHSLVPFAVYAQEWNYGARQTYADSKGVQKTQRANMWLPPSCATGVRGLILAAQTSSEYSMVRDPAIRAVAESERLAIIHFYPSKFTEPSASDTTLMQNLLNDLADASGFSEIRHAPWFSFGHSAGSHFAMRLAYWKPERTIGAMVYKGGLVPAPDWAKGSVRKIPIMAVQGQYEEFSGAADTGTDSSYQYVRRDILTLRKASVEHLMAPIVCPGEGHMGWSKRAAPLVALFIRTAVRKRIPPDVIATGAPVKLIPVEASSGLLAGTDPIEKSGQVTLDTAAGAPNPEKFFWLIDRPFAEAWKEFYKIASKKRQNVAGTANKPTLSPSVNLILNPGSRIWEGRVKIGTTYQMQAKSTSGLPVDLVLQEGPAIVDGKSFFIHPCRYVDDSDVRLILRQDGNDTYKVGDRMVKIKFDPKTGTAQTLTVPSVPALKVGGNHEINATATSGLPVTLDVIYGPAVMEGKKLVVKPFPSRSGKSTILVRAGQGGGGSFATATPVDVYVQVTGGTSGTNDSPLVGYAGGPRHLGTVLGEVGKSILLSAWTADRTGSSYMMTGIAIKDASGRVVIPRLSFQASSNKIPSSQNLRRGLYILELDGPSGRATGKLLLR